MLKFRNKIKKIWLITLLLVSLISSFAFAKAQIIYAGRDEDNIKSISESVNSDNSDLVLLSKIKDVKCVTEYNNKGILVDELDTVTFGSYPQNDVSGSIKEPIEWVVLEKDIANHKALLLSKYILDNKCYNEKYESITWENCDLRKWLNQEFIYKTFNEKERNQILETKIQTQDNPRYGIAGGRDTYDNIFCLSIEEYKRYFRPDDYNMIDKNIAETRGTEYAKNVNNNGKKLSIWGRGGSPFWLRSPGMVRGMADYVGGDGTIPDYWKEDKSGAPVLGGNYVYCNFNGVRPALWVRYE